MKKKLKKTFPKWTAIVWEAITYRHNINQLENFLYTITVLFTYFKNFSRVTGIFGGDFPVMHNNTECKSVVTGFFVPHLLQLLSNWADKQRVRRIFWITYVTSVSLTD